MGGYYIHSLEVIVPCVRQLPTPKPRWNIALATTEPRWLVLVTAAGFKLSLFRRTLFTEQRSETRTGHVAPSQTQLDVMIMN